MQKSTVASHIAAGFAKAASIIGGQELLFRANGANSPVGGTALGRLYCAWDVNPKFSLSQTAQANHAYAVLLADTTQVQVGDYLVGDDTHFVARVEPLRAALCVLCNETIDFLSTDVTTTAGTNGYGGYVAADNAAVATGWPVSMSARTRGGTDITKLPSDTRGVYYDVLAPPIPSVTLTFGMRIRDSTGQDYEIISAELSNFGWRLVAGLATT